VLLHGGGDLPLSNGNEKQVLTFDFCCIRP
jgi:hypothetical protein